MTPKKGQKEKAKTWMPDKSAQAWQKKDVTPEGFYHPKSVTPAIFKPGSKSV